MKKNNDWVELNKQRIISLLSSTGRKGMDNVIFYLEESGFFTAPGSFGGHHDWKGGLAEHSLGVYDKAVAANGGISTPGIVISALLHDICKGRQFFMDGKGLIRTRYLQIKGHGQRACILLKRLGLELTKDEKCAICWHKGENSVRLEDMGAFNSAKDSSLYQLIHDANGMDAQTYKSARAATNCSRKRTNCSQVVWSFAS